MGWLGELLPWVGKLVFGALRSYPATTMVPSGARARLRTAVPSMAYPGSTGRAVDLVMAMPLLPNVVSRVPFGLYRATVTSPTYVLWVNPAATILPSGWRTTPASSDWSETVVVVVMVLCLFFGLTVVVVTVVVNGTVTL